LFKKVARFFRAQIKHENGRAVLLQDRIEAIRRTDMADLRQCAEESLHAADDIGILRIQNAYGG
jgi:hypothetical protein